MKQVKYIFVNETHSKNPTCADLGRIVSDFRHSHIVSAAELSPAELIRMLIFISKQWPDAKILGLSEINGHKIRASGFMNSIRHEMSNQMSNL